MYVQFTSLLRGIGIKHVAAYYWATLIIYFVVIVA